MARHCRISGGYYTNTQALTNIFIPLYLAYTLSHSRISGGYYTHKPLVFSPSSHAYWFLFFLLAGHLVETAHVLTVLDVSTIPAWPFLLFFSLAGQQVGTSRTVHCERYHVAAAPEWRPRRQSPSSHSPCQVLTWCVLQWAVSGSLWCTSLLTTLWPQDFTHFKTWPCI